MIIEGTVVDGAKGGAVDEVGVGALMVADSMTVAGTMEGGTTAGGTMAGDPRVADWIMATPLLVDMTQSGRKRLLIVHAMILATVNAQNAAGAVGRGRRCAEAIGMAVTKGTVGKTGVIVGMTGIWVRIKVLGVGSGTGGGLTTEVTEAIETVTATAADQGPGLGLHGIAGGARGLQCSDFVARLQYHNLFLPRNGIANGLNKHLEPRLFWEHHIFEPKLLCCSRGCRPYARNRHLLRAGLPNMCHPGFQRRRGRDCHHTRVFGLIQSIRVDILDGNRVVCVQSRDAEPPLLKALLQDGACFGRRRVQHGVTSPLYERQLGSHMLRICNGRRELRQKPRLVHRLQDLPGAAAHDTYSHLWHARRTPPLNKDVRSLWRRDGHPVEYRAPQCHR